MRLTPDQIVMIHAVAADLAGPEASVRLFGSRLDDAARGGDVDLLVELPHPVEAPAPLAAASPAASASPWGAESGCRPPRPQSHAPADP